MTATDAGLLGLLDTDRIRADFPILTRRLDGDRPLVYLDSANTSQKPQQVIDAMADHYARHNANVARAVHQLGAESTQAFEAARDTVAAFIKAPSRDEVIFTKNSSEALNLVANTLAWARGEYAVGEGDEVVISEMEHHSNIVPWQLLTERTGATLRWFGLTDEGRLDLSNIDDLITERTKVVSLVWVSNMLGTVNPVAEIARRAHEVGALVVLDASQAVPQLPVDVVASGADLVAFTGHKVVGPTGIGVLWGRREVLEALPPFLGGGEMIETPRGPLMRRQRISRSIIGARTSRSPGLSSRRTMRTTASRSSGEASATPSPAGAAAGRARRGGVDAGVASPSSTSDAMADGRRIRPKPRAGSSAAACV